jgi:hypothetical protein
MRVELWGLGVCGGVVKQRTKGRVFIGHRPTTTVVDRMVSWFHTTYGGGTMEWQQEQGMAPAALALATVRAWTLWVTEVERWRMPHCA